MIKTIIEHIDRVTMTVFAVLIGLTFGTIALMNYVYIDRMLENDAEQLLHEFTASFGSNKNSNAQHKLAHNDENLFINEQVHKQFNYLLNGMERQIDRETRTLDQSNDQMNLNRFEAKTFPEEKFFQSHIETHLERGHFLNELEQFAIYLTNGKVLIPEKFLMDTATKKRLGEDYEIISSVKRVFHNKKPLYALRETGGRFVTQHYIPYTRNDHVVAVVMLQASQSETGVKMASAVNKAVTMTTYAVIPIIGLVIFLIWAKSRDNLIAKEKIDFITDHDLLTGLANLSGLFKYLNQAIDNATIRKNKFALLTVDLDGFNQINDSIGHVAGDLFLKTIAERILKTVDPNAIVTRISADEFAVIIQNIDNENDAVREARNILVVIAQPYQGPREEIHVTCSIGIAIAPDNGADPESLLKNADLALAHTKKCGGNGFHFFEFSMDQFFQNRYELEKDLTKALKNKEFKLFYQPQVDLKTREPIGYEALLRWEHPERGLVSPGEFIPILEETKMILAVGEYVLNQACIEATRWTKPRIIAVNMSAIQFAHQNVPRLVEKALIDSGLEPHRLELEITESLLLSDTDTVIKMLEELNEMGVKIAMDDFGTGYSSLGYISKLKLDKIKIDRSFISNMREDERSRAIIQTIMGLGHALNITITAEGIETEDQLLLLRAAGCYCGQGFLFGRPAEKINFETEHVSVA